MDKMAARLESEGPAPEHSRTVLLAPSWGKSALFGVYGGKIIDVLLKTGYHVIVRPHPQSFQSEKEMLDKIMAEYPPSEQLEWNRDTDNFDVLRRSDILVSDFSGVIFDFTLIYDKPVIYTDPDFDLAPYDAWWLNKPLWTASALPRIGRRLTDENIDEIEEFVSDAATAAGTAVLGALVTPDVFRLTEEGIYHAARLRAVSDFVALDLRDLPDNADSVEVGEISLLEQMLDEMEYYISSYSMRVVLSEENSVLYDALCELGVASIQIIGD
jgi:hypothetical protein